MIFGEHYPSNPRLEVRTEDETMLRLWRLFRGSMTGAGALPDAGGALDQPAVMVEAFMAMSDAANEIAAEQRRRDRSAE